MRTLTHEARQESIMPKIEVGHVNMKYDAPTVYVGRPSPLGNPFPVKRSKFSAEVYSVEESLRRYGEWLYRQITIDSPARREIDRIRTMPQVVLTCWCVDENGHGECHGRIIKKAADYLNNMDEWIEGQDYYHGT